MSSNTGMIRSRIVNKSKAVLCKDDLAVTGNKILKVYKVRLTRALLERFLYKKYFFFLF